VVRVIARPGGRYKVRGELDEVRERCVPERVVLECDCRARWILDDLVSIRCIEEFDIPDCGVCGERFVLTLTEDRRSYS